MTRCVVWGSLSRGLLAVSKRLDHGSQAVMTRCVVWGWLFWGQSVVSKRLDHGSSHPTKALRALARTPTGLDDTVCSLVDLFRGEPFHHFTFPPFHLQRSCHPRSISFPHPFQPNRKSPGTLRPQGFVYRLNPMDYFIRIIFLVLLYLPVLIL